MNKEREFKRADYEKTEAITIRLGDALPYKHIARYIVEIIKLLDLSQFYEKYGEKGGAAYAPEVLLGLLLYGYATGVSSSRKIEEATYETIAFRYIAGDMHPDHDTIASFRQENLSEIKGIFVQVLLIAKEAGMLQIGDISLDGSKIHADASRHSAVSYGRLKELEAQYQAEIEELFAMAEQKQGKELKEGVTIENEVKLRQVKIERLAAAKAVIEARAKERDVMEQAKYAEKMADRAEYAEQSGKKAKGRKPVAPKLGAGAKDQYNFTDPESQIMKQGNRDGFEQCYNGQVAVEHKSRLIVGESLSNHTVDQKEALPTLEAIPAEIGKPDSVCLDAGFFSQDNVVGILAKGIEPYIATGRDPHHQTVQSLLAEVPAPPAEDASPKVKMAYKLKTDLGHAIYKLRKSTVEPVIGIIKEVMGFRQFSLRGLSKAAGEWSLVCLAYNLKRMHVLKFA